LSVQFIDVVNLPGRCDEELPGRFFNFFRRVGIEIKFSSVR
jgi:hypothetical protein